MKKFLFAVSVIFFVGGIGVLWNNPTQCVPFFVFSLLGFYLALRKKGEAL